MSNFPDTDFLLRVSRGQVPGHSFVNKFGHNADVDTANVEDLWTAGATWVSPTAARTHDAASSAAADAGTALSTGTATGGTTTTLVDTGADFVAAGVAVGDVALNDTNDSYGYVTVVATTTLTVEPMRAKFGVVDIANASSDAYRIVTAASTGIAVIQIVDGLDDNYDTQCEFIITNGTSNVATANTYRRINRMTMVLAGSGGVAAGNIQLTAQTDATVTAEIAAGSTSTLMAIYTIPNGQTGFLTSIATSKRDKTGNITVGLFLREQGGDWTERATSATAETVVQLSSDLSSPILEKTDVKLTVSATVNGTQVDGGFTILLIADGS